MPITENSYYYDHQLKDYNLLFMAVFQGLQVQVGAKADAGPRLIDVPIHYAYPDRVVAAIMADNTQNKPLRIPCMSAMQTGISLDEGSFKGLRTERRSTFTPVGGVVPDDMEVVHQRMPIPYILTFELNLFASNMDQMFQMIEQIVMVFEPSIDVQRSDSLYDWARTSKLTLKDIRLDNNYPSGTSKRTIQTVLTFDMTAWIASPIDIRRDFIERIYLRVGAVNSGSTTSEEILNDLDDEGLTYVEVASDDGMKI